MGRVPAEPGGFIGRNAELVQLETLHQSVRLLTMIGPSGVGKTRLGLRLAARVDSSHRDGVWFVDIASVSDEAMLAHTLACALGVREEPGQSGTDALIGHLREREAMLILDSCEHALDACASLTRALCDNCPQLHLLAISRVPMNTSGDTIWRAPPLSLPAARADRASVALADSVRLLVNRARRSGTRLAITRHNYDRVAEMCNRLGGLPLALELVAARVSSSTTTRLMTHLRHQPDARHILRTTLDWALGQLTGSQAVLLRRVSVFGGAWDLDSAQVVCADSDFRASAIETDLHHLVAASLIHRARVPGSKRYRLLDSVRAYALDALQAAGEVESVNRRFVLYMLALAERSSPEAVNADHAALLERDADNIRAALAFAISSGDAEHALRLATAASTLWYFRGYFAEGCEWLRRGLALTGPASSLSRARATAWLGQLLQIRGEYEEAERWLVLAAEQNQALGEMLGSAFAVAMLGQLALMRGDLARAGLLCAEAAERLDSLGNPSSIACRLQSAIVAIEVGDLRHASTVIAQCEEQSPEPSTSLAGWLRLVKGRLAEASGDLLLARRHLTRALAQSRASGEQLAVITAQVELGYVALEQRGRAIAQAAFSEVVELAQRAGERIQLARALEGLAGTLATVHPTAAVSLASAADRLRTTMGATSWPSDQRRMARWLPTARQTLQTREFRRAWKQGRAWDTAQAVAQTRTFTTGVVPPPRTRSAFTARERQIISLLAQAQTNEQIAAKLAIRPATARTHVEHVMNKLGLHRRAELVLWASKQ